MAGEILRIKSSAVQQNGALPFVITVYQPGMHDHMVETSEGVDELTFFGFRNQQNVLNNGFSITSDSLATLEAQSEKLAREVRHLRLVPVAGVLGLACVGLIARYDPRIATTLAGHMERAGADIGIVTGGIGGLCSVLFGSIMWSDAREERRQAQIDFKNLRLLLDEGRVEPDNGTYFFRWTDWHSRHAYNLRNKIR